MSLANARFIREDYVKVVRSLIRTTSKFKGDAARPDLEVLGVMPSEEAIEASAASDDFLFKIAILTKLVLKGIHHALKIENKSKSEKNGFSSGASGCRCSH